MFRRVSASSCSLVLPLTTALNPSAIAALTAALGGLLFALVWLRISQAPGWRHARWLALVAATGSVYSTADITIVVDVAPEIRRWAMHLSLFGTACHAIAWLLFLSARQGRGLLPAERVLVGANAAMAGLALVPGLMVSTRVLVFKSAWLGITYQMPEPTWLGIVAYGALLAALLSVAWINRHARDAGERFALRAVPVLLLLVANDALTTTHVISTPLLLNVGMFLVVASFGFIEFDQFVRDARRFQDLNRSLELRVEERSAELARAQGDLARAEKLAAIGQLAAGVAHEVNNPAAATLANLSYVLHHLRSGHPASEEVRSALVEAKLSTERIAQIVRQLLAAGRLAGTGLAPTGPCRVAVVVAQARQTALATAGDDAEVRIDVPPDLVALSDPGLLEQVLINLIVNGVQASSYADETGRVTVSATKRGAEVEITVRDDGPGVPPEVQAHIFEPFFTTKGQGRGTGLGLAVSLGLMHSLGGDLRLADGSPGRTSFVVRMPASDAPAEAPGTAPSLPAGTTHSGLRVLVIDDERTVRNGIKRLLSAHFDVETTGTVAAALERLDREPTVDAILCDVLMPDGGGRAMEALLAEQKPHMLPRTAFITGGAVGEETKAWIERLQNPVLQKPARLSTLRETILDLVAAASPTDQPPHQDKSGPSISDPAPQSPRPETPA